MFKHGLVEPSFMPPPDIRQLRELMRYRNKLVNISSGEKIDSKIHLQYQIFKLQMLLLMSLEKHHNLL